ncbi:hypothetical protein BsWGS_17012 [Bradybaena similaris]
MSCEQESRRQKPRTSIRATPQLPPKLEPRAAPRVPPRPAPRPPARPPRPVTQQPSPSDMSDSVFTYSPQESEQEEWQPYYYYPSPNQPVGSEPKFSQSDYAEIGPTSLGLKRNRVPVGAYSQQGPTGEGCPSPGQSPGSERPPSAKSPSTRRARSFPYSTKPSGQEEVQQYQYSPTPSPGHTKEGSYTKTPSSQTLVKRRLRLQQDTDPQQAIGMGLGEIDRSPRINDRSQAASPQSARTANVGPAPTQQRRKLSFHDSQLYSPDTTVRSEYADDTLLAETPHRKRLSVMPMSKLNETSIYESPVSATPQRRSQLMDTSMYDDTPTPTTIQRRSQLMDTSIYDDTPTPTNIQRRSQLTDTSIYQDSPSPKRPQQNKALIDSLKRRFKAMKIIAESPEATKSDASQAECANQQTNETASSPVLGRARFNKKSVAPIQKIDFSTRCFEAEDSPDNFSCPATSSDKTFDFTSDEFNCGFPQDPSGQSEKFSPGADRRRSYSSSALQQSPLEARRAKFKSKDQATMEAGNVEVLTTGTFGNFLKEQEMAVVMFHNSMINKGFDMQSWAQPSSKLPPSMKQTFGSVDCAVEAHLCAKESISSFPFFKVYYKGRLVNAVKDLASLSY